MLSFAALRAANILRAPEITPINNWSPGEWACALSGEVGEACNIIKKMHRIDDALKETTSISFRTLKEYEKAQYQLELAKEFADIQVYLDILACRCGVNLEEATISKFNEVSDRYNSKIKL